MMIAERFSTKKTGYLTQEIHGGWDPVGSEYFYWIRHDLCWIAIGRILTRISSEFVEIR